MKHNACLAQVDIMLKMRLFFEIIRMRHPRFRPERFDLVVAPRHDYYTSTAKGGHQQEVPSLLLRWIFPREQPPRRIWYAMLSHSSVIISGRKSLAAKRWHADSEQFVGSVDVYCWGVAPS